MVEPAELLLIKDQYGLAFHSLSRGLDAEEAQDTAQALEFYRKGRQHLVHGVDVPTAGERQKGSIWDTARQLQQKMRDTLPTVDAHLSELEASQPTTGAHKTRLLMDLPPNFSNEPDSQPPQRSLYPTILPPPPPDPAANQDNNNAPKTPPLRPPSPSPAALQARTHPVSVVAPGGTTIAMANAGDQPPAYTPQATIGHRSLAYGGLGLGKQTGEVVGGDENELLSIPEGVQMFFVAPNGQVSSLFYPSYLRIVTSGHQKDKDPTVGRIPAYLHVCDWLYPLSTDTPVLLASSGIFMFPDTLAETPGSYVGIVLSSELPASDREMFVDVLSQLADLRIQQQGQEGVGSEDINLSEKIPLGPPTKEETGLTVPTGATDKPLLPGWSEKMAQGILSGATRLSLDLVKGAEATGRAIHKGAAKIRDHLTPEDTPSEVSPGVTKSLHTAKQATGGAVKVSQFLVNGVSTVAGHMAEKLAPHVKKQGAKLIPESLKKTKEGQPSKVEGAKLVAVSSVQGFSSVWSSLETGAKIVGKSVASETVTTVKYKYGDEAGQATDTALKSVVNVAVTAHNIDNLGIKAFLKTTGKQTAKAMVKKPDSQTGETEAIEEKKEENQAETKGEEEEEKKK